MNMNTIRCYDKVPKEEIPNMESIEGKSIIFLDYDGVVNTLRIEDDAKDLRSSYGYPNDNKVNDTQAIRWLLLFCRKFNYYIIVTSTWRLHDNYKEDYPVPYIFHQLPSNTNGYKCFKTCWYLRRIL